MGNKFNFSGSPIQEIYSGCLEQRWGGFGAGKVWAKQVGAPRSVISVCHESGVTGRTEVGAGCRIPHISHLLSSDGCPVVSFDADQAEVGWPTILVCSGLRELPGPRLTVLKARQSQENQDELITLSKRDSHQQPCILGFHFYSWYAMSIFISSECKCGALPSVGAW